MNTNIEEAEVLKNQGNEAFKVGNYTDAVNYYTQAICKVYPPDGKLIYWIEFCESEIYFSNRAASYMGLNRFHEAYLDLKKSLDLCPTYAKSAWRLFTCCLRLGHIEEAKNVLDQYMKLIPEEKGFKEDIWTLNEVHNLMKLIDNAVQGKDFWQAIFQTTQLIERHCAKSEKL